MRTLHRTNQFPFRLVSLIVASGTQTIKLWPLATSRCAYRILEDFSGQQQACGFEVCRTKESWGGFSSDDLCSRDGSGNGWQGGLSRAQLLHHTKLFGQHVEYTLGFTEPDLGPDTGRPPSGLLMQRYLEERRDSFTQL